MMSVGVLTVKANCVIWRNIELPHPGKSKRSPGFCLDGFDCNFETRSSWGNRTQYSSSEQFWCFRFECLKKSLNYVIVPYAETAEKYVRIAPTLDKGDIYRSTLSNTFGSDRDEITLLFLFSPDELSFQEIDSGKEAIQSLCLEGLSKDIEQLLDKDEYVDATLKCGDKSFSVHRSILTARSEVFSAMFQHDMSEKNSGKVDIVDLEPNILEEFLRYLYSGKVEQMTVSTALDLYQAAEKYSVCTLKQLCVSYILENMSEDVVCEVLLLADKTGDVEFLDKVAAFTAKTGEFLKSTEWKDFTEKFPNLAVKVFFKYLK